MRRTNRLATGETWMIVKSPVRLREHRVAAGLTQTDLARLIPVSQQYISMLETGEDDDCSEHVARRISRFLGKPLGDLFDTATSAPMAAVTTSSRGTGSAA